VKTLVRKKLRLVSHGSHNNLNSISDFFFCDAHLLCSLGNFCERSNCDFFLQQLILLANTAAFFCSLVELDSHSFSEGDSRDEISTRWRCFEKIDHFRDSWLVLRNNGLQTGFSCLKRYEIVSFMPGVGNLRPAWTFDMAHIRIFVTQVRVQHRVKTKLHDKQGTYLDSTSREVTLPHSWIKVEF